MKNNVYNNSRSPVNSVRVITCVHDTPAVNVGGRREEIGKDPEVLTPSMTHLMMVERRKRKKHRTSNLVAIIRFTPATTEGES
jgi:hypothetical protein